MLTLLGGPFALNYEGVSRASEEWYMLSDHFVYMFQLTYILFS